MAAPCQAQSLDRFFREQYDQLNPDKVTQKDRYLSKN